MYDGHPAAVGIELDTTAPDITWGTVSSVMGGDEFDIAYEITEPELVSVVLESQDGNVWPGEIGPDTIHFEINKYASDTGGTIIARMRDDVDNERIRTQPIMIINDRFPLVILVRDQNVELEVEDRSARIAVDKSEATVEVEPEWP